VAFGLVPVGWAHPCAYMALGSCLSAGHTPTHTWRLGLASMLGTPLSTRDILLPAWGAWHTPVLTWRLGSPRPNYHWALHVADPK